MARYCYGIDVGGSKIELVAYACVNNTLDERWRRRIDTPAQDFTRFVEAIQHLVADADAAVGERGIVGIGMPGIVDRMTGAQLSSNVPAINGRQLLPALQTALLRPIHLANDCRCFALSEARGGAAEGAATMFGAILGTGAGGGYCVAGRLIAGANGMAGEWGHWSLPAHLQRQHHLPIYDCPCGLRGCLEQYVSGSGLQRLHRHQAASSNAPVQDVTTIVAQAEQGDARSQRSLDIYLDLLGHAFATLTMALDPEVIVLGGGLSKLAYLYDALPTAITRHLFKGVQTPRILPPVFGDAGGARGAALVALQMESA